MAKLVSYEDIDQANQRTVSVSATSAQLSESRLGKTRRKSIVIVPLTAAVIVTLNKSFDNNATAVANQGIVLSQYQPYVEVEDQRTDCYQGAFQVVANGAGSVAITEVFESPSKDGAQ